jgi:Na+/H+-dicarboxylate symporter
MSDIALSTPQKRAIAMPRVNGSAVVMTLYLLFLLLPIYWLVNMSLMIALCIRLDRMRAMSHPSSRFHASCAGTTRS